MTRTAPKPPSARRRPTRVGAGHAPFNRATITDRIAKLVGEQPWAGYDEQSVEAVTEQLDATDSKTAREVARYERDHKDRAGVIDAAERRLSR